MSKKRSIFAVESKTKHMEATKFNPTQLHLLEMFSLMKTEDELLEMQSVLSKYYFDKVERMGAQLAAQKGWTPEVLEEMSHEHFRSTRK